MATKDTPHLNEWVKTFKSVASFAGKIGADTLKSMTPNISTSASSAVEAMRDSREIFNKAKSQVSSMKKDLERGTAGRDARSIIDSAYNDIKNGSFSLDKLGDSTYDTVNDFTVDTINSLDDETSSSSNTAILGKAVVEGNAASIEGMRQMTTTLSNVNIKTSKAAVAKMTNVVLMGIGHMNSHMMTIERKLDNINANMATLVQFQTQTQLATNQAALNYYEASSEMTYKIGEALASIQDMQKRQAERDKLTRSTKDYSNRFDVSNGFDLQDYKKFVKKNFDNSAAGMMLSMGNMAGSMLSMTSGFGVSPVELIAPMLLGGMLPKKTKKSIARLDKSFTHILDNILYRIGDMSNSGNGFLSMVGSIFGKKRGEGFSKANMSNFKKDAMSWNGIAQKTLVEVIPSYLARIESALTHKGARFYDMNSGKFMSEKLIEKEYKTKFHDTIEYGMSGFTKKVNESIENNHINGSAARDIKKYLNDLVYDQIMNGQPNIKKTSNDLRTIFQNSGMSEKDIRDIMMEFSDTMRSTMDSLRQVNQSIEQEVSGSVFRNLFNYHNKDKQNKLHSKGNIFAGTEFLSSGIRADRASARALEREAARKQAEEFEKDLEKKFGEKFFSKIKRNGGFDDKTSSYIDNLTNNMYDWSMGFDGFDGDGFVMRDSEKHFGPIGKARNWMYSEKIRRQAEKEAARKKKEYDEATKRMTNNPYALALRNQDEETPVEEAIVDTSEATKEAVNQLTNIHKGFFGKDGFLSNFWKNTSTQKGIDWLKKKLFDEKDGLFAPLVNNFKDAVDYLKYKFTGEEYTDRQNIHHEAESNSVLHHLRNGYDFLFTNSMRYIFGDKYAENETFQKYFKWMDWKGNYNRKKERQKAGIDDEENLKHYQQERISSKNILAIEDKSMTSSSEGSSEESKLVSNVNKNASADGMLAMLREGKRAALKKVHPDNNLENQEEATKRAAEITAEYAKYEAIIRESVVDTAENITAAGEKMTKAMIGSEDDVKLIEDSQHKANESFFSRVKRNMPKSVAASIVGAGVGASVAMHGTGLLGSLFLPGGPVGGAIMGLGLSILSQSNTLREFIFGKENEDGKKVGGLISDKTQKFMKKNAPLIIGAGVLGGLKKMIFGGSPISGPGGFLLNTLLPGGPIGGALVGTGIALLKNSETFNKILFGKKGEDGKRVGGIFNQSVKDKFNKVFGKSKNFIKGGIAGLGAGAIAGATLSQAGILGASLSMGGPVGMGLAGLGIGIASQTEKFQDLLFGTKEFDKDGNLKGRYKDGLLYKIRNMLMLNVFEPMSAKVKEKVEDFAFYVKDAIVYPFRLVFGPIIDSMKGIKENIVNIVHDAFNNVAETVGKAFKNGINKIFSPITKLLGSIGKGLLKTVEVGAKLALTPISAPLKLLQVATLGKRLPAYMEENKHLVENFGTIISAKKAEWAEKGDDPEYKGLRGIVNRYKDIKAGTRQAMDDYHTALEDQGLGSLGWRRVRQEKADDKKLKKELRAERKKWNSVDRYRRELSKKAGYVDVRYTDEEFDRVRSNFAKKGIDKDFISTQADLNMLLYDKEAWKQKFLNPKTDEATINDDGVKIQENEAQVEARNATSKYQEEMLKKVDPIAKVFGQLGMQDALKHKKRVSLKEIDKINKQLKALDLNWEDIGIDPSQLVDINDISNADYDEFLKGAEKDSNSKGFKDFFFKKYINPAFADESSATVNKHDETSSSDKTVALLEEIKEASDVTAAATITDVPENMHGASNSDVQKSLNVPSKSRFRRIVNRVSSTIGSLFRRKKEEEESAKAAGLAGDDNSDEEVKVDENGNPIKVTSNGETKENKSFLSKLISGTGGFFSSVFGGIGNMLGSASAQTKLGLAGIALLLFGKPIIEMMTIAKDKFMEYAWPWIKKTFGNIVTWWREEGPAIIENVKDTMITNIGYIVDSALTITKAAAEVIGAALGNIGKRFVNWIVEKLPGDWPVPFPDVAKKKTYTDRTEAIADNGGSTLGVVQNPETGEWVILNPDEAGINPDGTADNVGDAGLAESWVHAGASYATSKGVRTIVNKGAKVGVKAAGWLTGITPVGKAAKGVGKGVYTLGKGAVNTGKAIFGKAGKETVEAAAETTAKEAGETIVKSNKKTLMDLINKAVEKISGVAKKAAKYIPENTFTKAISNFCGKLKTLVKGASDDVIAKLGGKVAKKAGVASAKSAAMATVVVQVGLTTYDLISGFCEASYLFQVDEEYVDFKMRTISSLMKALFGFGIMSWIDLILEIYSALTGTDAKKDLAMSFYKLMSSDGEIEAIDRAQVAMQLEVDKYNAANNTQLDVRSYNEKKNAKWYTKAWNWMTGKGEDYSKYKVSDAEIDAQIRRNSMSSGSSYPVAYGNPSAGRMQSKAVGYGPSYTQNDARWANFPIGTFPDGTPSTMATGGCGPTVMSMVANEFGSKASPVAIAQYAKQNGYISQGGANADLFTEGANKLGLRSNTENSSSLQSALSSGNPVVIAGKSSIGSSPYTEAGHILMASGYDPSTGNTLINDPMTPNKRMVNINDLKSGLTNAWSYSVGYGNPVLDRQKDRLKRKELSKEAAKINNKQAEKKKDKNDFTNIMLYYHKKGLTNSVEYKGYMGSKPNSPAQNYYFGLMKKRYSEYQDSITDEEIKKETEAFIQKITKEYGNPLDAPLPKNSRGLRNWSYSVSYFLKHINEYNSQTKSGMEKIRELNATEQQNLAIAKNVVKTYDMGCKKVFDAISGVEVMSFQTPVFYSGMTVETLKYLAEYKSILLSAENTSLFAIVYKHYVTSKKYKNTDTVSVEIIESILESETMSDMLGGHGTANGHFYKNGFPFFQTSDERWSNIPWRKGKVGTRGSDLASLAMIASAYGGNLIPPDYIYNKWLSQYPSWYNSTNGLVAMNVFRDGGFNAMKATQVNGQRLRVQSANDTASILSALRSKKPVYLTGYKYEGSPFGGSIAKNKVNTSGKGNPYMGGSPDDIGSAVALYANNTHFAVNNPYTNLTDPSVFDVDTLSNGVGPDGKSRPILNAYVVTDPNGNGLGSSVDISTLNKPEAQFQAISDNDSWVDILMKSFGNFSAIAGNFLTSALTGKKYQSIFDAQNLSDDGADSTGVGVSSDIGSGNSDLRLRNKIALGYGGVLSSTVIKTALREVGVVEQYNNNVKYNTEYYGKVVNGNGYPWCCAFVWWVFKQAGASHLFGKKTAYCPTLLSHFKKLNRFHTTGQPGDVIFFDFGKGRASHVGIVISRNSDGSYQTVEGNTSSKSQDNGGCVQIKTRKSSIIGFGRPAYADEVSPTAVNVSEEMQNTSQKATETAYTGNNNSGSDHHTNTIQTSFNALESKYNTTWLAPLSDAINQMTTKVNERLSKSINVGHGPGSKGVTSWLEQSLDGHISSDYGHRSTSLGDEYHHGVDISAPFGHDILSPIDGTVVDNGTDAAGYGNYTVIRDSVGNNHLFAHMNAPSGYGLGSHISQSDVIGAVGSSGKSTGSHLHYEIRKNGNKYSSMDPSNYNINKVNTKVFENSEAPIGAGNKDINTELRDKLNVALNADGVEEKLDTLIGVMKTWAERDAQRENIQNTSNTTNNTSIVYGNGKTKTTKTKSSKNISSMDTKLATIHQAIASK